MEIKDAASGETKMKIETFALTEGVAGQIQCPSPMSQEAFDDFVYHFEGVKNRLLRAVPFGKTPENHSTARTSTARKGRR